VNSIGYKKQLCGRPCLTMAFLEAFLFFVPAGKKGEKKKKIRCFPTPLFLTSLPLFSLQGSRASRYRPNPYVDRLGRPETASKPAGSLPGIQLPSVYNRPPKLGGLRYLALHRCDRTLTHQVTPHKTFSHMYRRTKQPRGGFKIRIP